MEPIILDNDKLKYFYKKVLALFLNEAYQVLFDSREDPHHSAVLLENIMHCYIESSRLLRQNCEIKTAPELLEYMGMAEDEINEFEILRKKESSYYRDPQYDPEKDVWFKNEFHDSKDSGKVTGVVTMKGPYSV